MAFGTWHDNNDDLHLVDNDGKRMSHLEARVQVRPILEQMSKEQLVTALIDRMDVNDLIGFLTDANQSFKPGVLPAEQPA
jgi:Mg/Co/Ni transporter MgtE